METIFRDKNGRPVYVLGLQTHNSSNGCWEMIDSSIEAVKKYHGNTLEVPVYWYQLEPEEGQYNLSMVKELIHRVRASGLHLILLWFGFSKNADITYVPQWVKADPNRFWMAVGKDGAVTAQMSPFCQAGIQADKKAFCALMRAVKEEDENERTVIAIQVENEIGLYPLDRCYSKTAQEAFGRGVPDALMPVTIKDSGAKDEGRDWYDHFGRHAHEAFTAWYFAKAIETIASAGKSEYDLPMYLNAVVGEIRQELAGQSYSSGSPVGRVIDIYKIGAPSIALCAPDIYLAHKSGYLRVCAAHARRDNPLFIPETGTGGDTFAVNLLHAAGDYGAIGICGFGAEHTLDTKGELTAPSIKVADTMHLIEKMSPILLKHGGTGRVFCISQEEGQQLQYVKREKYHITFHFTTVNAKGALLGRNMRPSRQLNDDPQRFNQRGRALVYEANPYEYYISGVGFTARFLKRSDPYDTAPYLTYTSRASTELTALSIEEGHFDQDGGWVCEFMRRGDEIDCGAFCYPGIVLRVKLNPAPYGGYAH
jgi:beta-galactosidase GanA